MSESTSTPVNLPNGTPAGFWKVLCVIAERIPPQQLIWLALMLCLLILGLGWMGYASLNRATESKPATALASYIKEQITTKPDKAP